MPSKPAKSALNSAVVEKNKTAKPEKHDKVKNGKPLKAEKKVDKKLDGVKKHDSVKKEKKPEGGKAAKKPVESDDDEPLVRFTYIILINECINLIIGLCTCTLIFVNFTDICYVLLSNYVDTPPTLRLHTCMSLSVLFPSGYASFIPLEVNAWLLTLCTTCMSMDLGKPMAYVQHDFKGYCRGTLYKCTSYTVTFNLQ